MRIVICCVSVLWAAVIAGSLSARNSTCRSFCSEEKREGRYNNGVVIVLHSRYYSFVACAEQK